MNVRLLIRKMSDLANRSVEGPIAQRIKSKVKTAFPDLKHFEIFNDSYKHSGHHGMLDAKNKIESHFRLEIVSDVFEGKSLPARHRMVYGILSEEMTEGVHALQLSTRTEQEHIKKTKNL